MAMYQINATFFDNSVRQLSIICTSEWREVTCEPIFGSFQEVSIGSLVPSGKTVQPHRASHLWIIAKSFTLYVTISINTFGDELFSFVRDVILKLENILVCKALNCVSWDSSSVIMQSTHRDQGN